MREQVGTDGKRLSARLKGKVGRIFCNVTSLTSGPHTTEKMLHCRTQWDRCRLRQESRRSADGAILSRLPFYPSGPRVNYPPTPEWWITVPPPGALALWPSPRPPKLQHNTLNNSRQIPRGENKFLQSGRGFVAPHRSKVHAHPRPTRVSHPPPPPPSDTRPHRGCRQEKCQPSSGLNPYSAGPGMKKK